MRIFHYLDTTDGRRGGPQRMVADCARVLAAQGHRCTILTSDTTDSPREWLDAESGGFGEGGEGLLMPRVHKISSPSLPGGFFTRGQLRRVRSELERAEVLHLHCLWSTVGYQLATMARDIGIPYVVSLHGMLDDWAMSQGSIKKRAFLTLAGRTFLEKATRVHCTSQGEFEQSSKWHGGSAEVVPPLLDLEPFRSLPGPELALQKHPAFASGVGPRVLFLSRLHPVKRPELLLRATASLRDHGVNFRVAFAGTGDSEYVQSLRDLSSAFNLNDRVSFVGQVSGAEKFSLYQAADLFVLPSLQENFGMVLIEALACGAPVITTTGVDIWKDLKASGAGAIINDAERDLATELDRLLNDVPARQSMAEKARPWVLREFDEQRTMSRFEQFYQSCTKQPAADGPRGRRIEQLIPSEIARTPDLASV